MEDLTDTERTILDIENRIWLQPGPKAASIRERLDISANCYHQLLNALLDDPRALVHSPVLINRLRRRREYLRAARGSRWAS